MTDLSLGTLNGSAKSHVGAIGGTRTLTVSAGTYEGKLADQGVAVNYSNNTLSYDSTGYLALVKTGTGTLTLSNADNDYSGGTKISGGVISIADGGALGTGTITFDGGSLTVTDTTELTQALETTANWRIWQQRHHHFCGIG
jgi:autotransporter-associated beta strand protein